MQYSKDQVEKKRVILNDPTWRQPPLLIMNVSFYFDILLYNCCCKSRLNDSNESFVISDNGESWKSRTFSTSLEPEVSANEVEFVRKILPSG